MSYGIFIVNVLFISFFFFLILSKLENIIWCFVVTILKPLFQMVSMKLRRPYTTASIWSSGKITCTGATR